MYKYIYVGLIFGAASCMVESKQNNLDDIDITGKWYIRDVVNLKTKEKLNVSFIECPFMQMNENGSFLLENGFNTGSDKGYWELIDHELIVIDSSKIDVDTITFRISIYKESSMNLIGQDKKYFLNRNCHKKK